MRLGWLPAADAPADASTRVMPLAAESIAAAAAWLAGRRYGDRVPVSNSMGSRMASACLRASRRAPGPRVPQASMSAQTVCAQPHA